jgi:hypothetical protein
MRRWGILQRLGGLPLRGRSVKFTTYLETRPFEFVCFLRNLFEIITRKDKDQRGAQLSLKLQAGLLDVVMKEWRISPFDAVLSCGHCAWLFVCMYFQNKVRPALTMLTRVAYLSPRSPESRQKPKSHIQNTDMCSPCDDCTVRDE